MTAKTNAERQAALHQRRKEAGLKQVRNLWCHPEDESAIKAYAQKLARKRAKEQKLATSQNGCTVRS